MQHLLHLSDSDLRVSVLHHLQCSIPHSVWLHSTVPTVRWNLPWWYVYLPEVSQCTVHLPDTMQLHRNQMHFHCYKHYSFPGNPRYCRLSSSDLQPYLPWIWYLLPADSWMSVNRYCYNRSYTRCISALPEQLRLPVHRCIPLRYQSDSGKYMELRQSQHPPCSM